MRQNRVAKDLNPLLKKRLAVYALVGAAGLAASAPDANAEIVYTSARQFGEGTFNHMASIPIDLNHDGVVDFNLIGQQFSLFTATFGSFPVEVVFVNGADGSAAVSGVHYLSRQLAAALPLGAEVGPALNFQPTGTTGFYLAQLAYGHSGHFYNKKNKFLALKFNVDGRSYYGWARVNVKVVNKDFVFELVDYAYQNTPNTPIRAGEGIPQADAALPATLGLLAYGSDAIPAWRSGQ